MRGCGRPLLRDARRTRTWLVLAGCVLVIAALGLLVRGQARPDGLDSAIWHYFTDTVGGVALGAGTVLALAFLIDLAPGALLRRTSQ